MFRFSLAAAASIAAMTLPGAAVARDRTGYQAIAAGDLAAAERALVAERRIFPDRPELMLNLASVYSRTGRIADARALLVSAADAPAVAMDLPDGSVALSTDLATRALTRLGPVTIAGR